MPIRAETWLLFALSEAALCISPGPAVVYVTSNAIARGFEASLAATLGIVSGNIVYFIASAIGVGALILAAGDFFVLIKWAGVAYLAWLGLRMLSGHASMLPARSAALGTRRIYAGGLFVQLSNPKNLVFFIAILPPFIDTAGNVPLQVLILGVTSQLIETAVLASYGALGARAGRGLRVSRFAVWVDRAAGMMLLGVAAALALVRRVV